MTRPRSGADSSSSQDATSPPDGLGPIKPAPPDRADILPGDAQIADLDAVARTARPASAEDAAAEGAAMARAELMAHLADASTRLSAALKVGRTLYERWLATEHRAAVTEHRAATAEHLAANVELRAAAAETMVETLRIQVENLRQQTANDQSQLRELSARLAQTGHALDQVLNSTTWKLTGPGRRLAERMLHASRRRDPPEAHAQGSAAPPPGGKHAAEEREPVLTPGVPDSALRDEAGHADLPGSEPGPAGLSGSLAGEQDASNATSPDLLDNFDAEIAARLRAGAVLWSPRPHDSIRDSWAAARWILDLLHTRADLRQRFPRALTDGGDGAFAAWITGEGGRDLDLSDEACSHIANALTTDPAARARQYYFWREDLRATFPLALLPLGRQDFAAWMLEHREEGQLRLEEVWWLYMQCAENPAGELVRTYLFTPEWQTAHPDGLTLFGRDRFASWLSHKYDLPRDAEWLDPRGWPAGLSPVEQIRMAYVIRELWRQAHPNAFRSESEARAFLTWLATDASELPREHRDWCTARLQDGTAIGMAAPGVNIIGHFCYPSGLRVSVESIAEAIELAGGAVTRRDIRTDPIDDPRHAEFGGTESHDITLIHVQPEPFFNIAFSRSDLMERVPRTYRIAFWYWELDAVPDSWAETAFAVDEIWAATKFVADALRAISPVPVHTLFPGVRIATFTPRSRHEFGLPGREEGRFAFLFSFHMSSIMERKNPLGLIQAFRQAFRPEEPVDLVLKTTSFGRHIAQVEELRDAAAGANIFVLDQILTPDETLSLMDACDAYVSLHRSEGLGLTMAEAMLLGKPVIATRYSGNVDFMDDRNSLLVDYDLIRIGRPVPPYDEAAHWANPSIGHAAVLMRRLYDNQDWARDLGKFARHDARARFDLAAAGTRFVERLTEIKGRRLISTETIR